MENDLLIIPDIHGRDFWRQAVEKYPKNDTIFLGDYLDPYPAEKISPIEAIANFNDIILHAKAHPNVTLLIGNHDLHYICPLGRGSRMDLANAPVIFSLFIENLPLFRIAALRKINDKTIVFAHAPILEPWVSYIGEAPDPEILVNNLNAKLENIPNHPTPTAEALSQASYLRGGGSLYGSPLWADVRELYDTPILPAIDMMIFGHTQLKDAPIITDRWACLDCRRSFRLTPSLRLLPA